MSGSIDSAVIQFNEKRIDAINTTAYAEMNEVALAYDDTLVLDRDQFALRIILSPYLLTFPEVLY